MIASPSFFLALAALLAAAPQEPPSAPKTRLQVRAAHMVLGDGTTVDDGVLLVEDGRIVRVGRGVELDPSLPTVEHDGWLTAGIVVCQSESGAEGETYDSTRSVLPEARLAYAFDASRSDFEKARAAGITSMVITPSDGNLAGGITAVVKTDGEVLKKEAQLALSFTGNALVGGQALVAFSFGSADPHAGDGPKVSDDDLEGATASAGPGVDPERARLPEDAASSERGGPEDTAAAGRGAREPTSYAGAVRELARRFLAAGGSSAAFARAARGELPVLIAANDRDELARALGFAREHNLKGAVWGAPLAGELVKRLQESGFGAILGPYVPGQERRSLESLRKLAEAGVPVAFALDAPDHQPDELRLSVAMVLAAGADPVQVWKALTVDAARIAGVDDHVGALERGKDADFVLWSGDPLNLTSRVVATFVDGHLVYDGAKSE